LSVPVIKQPFPKAIIIFLPATKATGITGRKVARAPNK